MIDTLRMSGMPIPAVFRWRAHSSSGKDWKLATCGQDRVAAESRAHSLGAACFRFARFVELHVIQRTVSLCAARSFLFTLRPLQC